MRLVNAGYCAELYETENQQIIKLYKKGWNEEEVLQEYYNTKIINELRIPSPTVYEFVEMEGRHGFVMDKLQDFTMLNGIQQVPWKAVYYARMMAKLHYEIHSKSIVKKQLKSQREVYIEKINQIKTLSDTEKERLLKKLDMYSQSEMQCICHGDFHPMNILMQEDKPVIIDWIFATVGNPCADVAGTYMITKLLATNSAASTWFEKLLFNIFTPFFAEIYLSEYLRISGKTREEIIQWVPIRAATYMELGLPEQTEKELRHLVKKIIKE